MTWSPNVVTVASIITLVRQKADMQNTQFVTDTEIVKYIDLAYRKLYNHVINRFENYYVSTATTALTSAAEYDLPADFLKLIGVDFNRNGRSFTMQPWSFSERNRLLVGWIGSPMRYVLKAGKIILIPTPTNVGDSITIYYVPAPATLTSGSSIEVFNGFDEYIALDAAIQCKQKEESDVSILFAKQNEILQLINESLIGRDAGFPQKITDINRVNENTWFQLWGM